MKILYFCIFPLLVVSCGADKNSSTISAEKNNSNFLPDSSKQRLLKIIEGGWVEEEYIDVLVKLNSPMKALAFGLPQQQMFFDISNLKGDTLVNSKGNTFSHYGERFDVVFYKKNSGTVGMKIKGNFSNDPELLLDYSFEKHDTILLLTISASRNSVIHRFHRQFLEFPERDNVQYSALEFCVNENLFAGDWKMSGQTISFSADGRIRNFRDYYRYAITTFDENALSSPDKISFYNDTAEITYVFTIVERRLRLYEMKISGEKFSRGKIVAELIRK